MGRDIMLMPLDFLEVTPCQLGKFYCLYPLAQTFFWEVDVLDWKSKEECLTDVLGFL